MAIFGVRLEMESDNIPFVNRWYTIAPDLIGACDNGEDIWAVIKTITGNDVTCKKVHAWAVGVSPNQFLNRTINEVGGLSVVNPMKPEIVTRIFYDAQNSYPGYSDIRARLDSSSIDGIEWDATYKAILATALSGILTLLGADKIVQKNGDGFLSASISPEYHFHQLNKRHYNRPS